MTATPAVSVCIRAYRQGHHLQTALRSVLRQTFDDFEVVVSDDSGRLEDVARRCGDPRVRYSANPEPAGPAANLKRAIGLSRGRIVAILNDDDEWLPPFLATAVAHLEEDPTLGVVFTDALWGFGGRRVHYPMTYEPGRHASFLQQVLERGIPCSATVLRRAVWDQGERILPLQESMVGDLLLWTRAAATGVPFYYVDQPLAIIHVHRDQVSWGEAFVPRAIATLQALRFEDTRSEQMRQARLGELFMASARIQLTHRRFGPARQDIIRARRAAPARLGARDLLALCGLRELGIRIGCAHPRLLVVGLAAWRRMRPAVGR